jgi:hypothetical protein
MLPVIGLDHTWPKPVLPYLCFHVFQTFMRITSHVALSYLIPTAVVFILAPHYMHYLWRLSIVA